MTYAPPPPALPPVATQPIAPKRRTGLVIGLIAGGLVILLVLGFLGFLLVRSLLGSGQSATASAAAVPAGSIAWVEYSIDPSNQQKLEALGFINSLDGLRDAVEDSDLDIDLDEPGDADLKKALWDFIVDNDDTDLDISLDYDDDVRPWLGSRVAMGMLPSEDGAEPRYVVAVEASDTTAGVEAVETLVDDLEIDAEVGSRDGYVLVASEDVDLDDAFEDGSLAESDAFREAAASAGEWGLASYWVDLGQVTEFAIAASGSGAGGDLTDPAYWEQQIRDYPDPYIPYPDSDYVQIDPACDPNVGYCDEDYVYVYDGATFAEYDDYAEAYLDDHLDDLVEEQVSRNEGLADAQQAAIEQVEGTTAFGVLRFADGALELSGGVTGLTEEPVGSGDGSSVTGLPESTIAALAVTGVAEAIDTALSDENLALLPSFTPYGLGSGYNEAPTRDDVAEWLDESLGLDFPDDLETLFGRQFAIAVDEDVETDFSSVDGADEVIESGIAIVITSDDADATADAWQDLADRAEEQAGESLGIDIEADGDRVVISAGSHLDEVLEPDTALGTSDIFREALPAAEDADTLFFIDAAAVLSIIDDAGTDVGWLDGLQAVGFTSTVESKDSVSFVLRVTTER